MSATATIDAILDKILKLKAHAESAAKIGNKHEAKAFFEKVQELISEHGITQADLDDYAETRDDEFSERPDREYEQWIVRGETLAFEDAGQQASITRRQFAIGDWLIEGTEKWDRNAYADAARIFPHYARVTLRNFACVARNVQPSLRRDVLSWSHHAAVAPLEQELQNKYLGQAAAEKMSSAALRDRIDGEHPKPKPDNKPGCVHLPPDVMATIKSLAKFWEETIDSMACQLIEQAFKIPHVKKEIEEAEADSEC